MHRQSTTIATRAFDRLDLQRPKARNLATKVGDFFCRNNQKNFIFFNWKLFCCFFIGFPGWFSLKETYHVPLKDCDA